MRGVVLFLWMMIGSTAAHADDMSLADILEAAGATEQRYVAPRRSIVRDGFSFAADVPVRVVLFRPDVRVTEQSTAGLEQPKADWTEAARQQMALALQRDQSGRGVQMQSMPELAGDDARLMADYKKLFKSVADAAIRHRLFADKPLPTKTAAFDWTLGPGIKQLGALGGGDYGLFVYANDSYVSQGRKNAIMISRLMGAADDTPSESRIGYAGLVDLKTGELVWLNVDVNGRGDVRTASGAGVRVTGLLNGFPAPPKIPAKARSK